MRHRIVCFGDSNTCGFDPVTGGWYGADHRWPSVIQRELGDGFEVISEALSGRTTVFGTDEYRHINGYEYVVPSILSHEAHRSADHYAGHQRLRCGWHLRQGDRAGGAKAPVNTALSQPIWPGKVSFEL